MEVKVVREKISKEELKKIAQATFGDFVKVVVDIMEGVMAIGGVLHADEEAVLLQGRSKQENVWGVNIYPEKDEKEWLEFDSMVNIRPHQGNRSRTIENPDVREKIKEVIKKLTGD